MKPEKTETGIVLDFILGADDRISPSVGRKLVLLPVLPGEELPVVGARLAAMLVNLPELLGQAMRRLAEVVVLDLQGNLSPKCMSRFVYPVPLTPEPLPGKEEMDCSDCGKPITGEVVRFAGMSEKCRPCFDARRNDLPPGKEEL